jgi:hypothetical protein
LEVAEQASSGDKNYNKIACIIYALLTREWVAGKERKDNIFWQHGRCVFCRKMKIVSPLGACDRKGYII